MNVKQSKDEDAEKPDLYSFASKFESNIIKIKRGKVLDCRNRFSVHLFWNKSWMHLKYAKVKLCNWLLSKPYACNHD